MHWEFWSKLAGIISIGIGQILSTPLSASSSTMAHLTEKAQIPTHGFSSHEMGILSLRIWYCSLLKPLREATATAKTWHAHLLKSDVQATAACEYWWPGMSVGIMSLVAPVGILGTCNIHNVTGDIADLNIGLRKTLTRWNISLWMKGTLGC